ncbi:nucleoporin Nup186/Nup192/Nup205 [Aspergillus egyptiacus]|nr:nucleoporin Nup186/Nup192/Nup205 [Aspergillus egyptiacus]
MESAEPLAGLRGLYQDLSALSESSFVNIDRLCVELETHIHDFRTLLDKPTKSNASRQSVLSGKITVDDVEYSVNEEFQQGALQLADALDIDELLAATMFFRAQEDAQVLDRPPLIAAIMRFHERRHFLLEALRLIFQESFEVERETTQELMQEALAYIVEIKDGHLRNASLFTRKCLKSMEDIEKWLLLLGEQIQKASLVGESEDEDVMEAIEYQRNSLLQQHESLGAIVCFLFKGPYTSPEDLRILLNHLRKLERLDGVLVHYVPSIICSFVQHGSPERSGSYNEARSLDAAIVSSKDSQAWAHQQFHSAVIALWLAVYSGWDSDSSLAVPPGVNFEKEVEERTQKFMSALDDGGLDLLLAICAGVSGEDWSDPARSELVTMLLRDSASAMKESGFATPEMDTCSQYLKDLLMENFEVFTESCIANMPDAVRKLKAEEDLQRLDHITALKDGLTSNLHRGLVEARTHLESFLMVMTFAFEGRQDAAQEFWADPEGNLYGFLQWASKRQTVPRVSAFCELLCSISGGEDNATAAHRFLSEEDKFMSSKFKRSTCMNWSQMFAELQIYASRVTEKPSPTQTVHRARKIEPADMTEPESPVMLSCYLRLLGHLSRQSAVVREWMLQHSSFNIVSTLLTLCSGPLPTHLRATVFQALAGLMTDRSAINGNEMWLSVDQWISSGSMSAAGHNKVPLVSNPLVWHEQQAFEKIGESFDQANAFVVLMISLVSPAVDSHEYHLWLPFPESLGSSYRMPGIEPYVDFVLGQALSKKAPDLNESQARLLTYNCLDFALICLKSFNETIVTVLSGSSVSPDPTYRTSTLLTYVRLHPFARVAEWLYNEEVIKVLFATASQDIAAIAKAPSDSILVLSVVRSLQVMDAIMDLQSTYFNIVRPFIRSQAGSKLNVANSSVSAFEDCVLTNLKIIPSLCLYCSAGHQQLTVTSMALLEKLSSSRKLNKLSSPALSKWRSSNKIVEVLSTEVDLDSVSRPLVSQMQPEARELEFGSQSSVYLIRESLLGLLNSCLDMFSDRPTVAHLLLGFRCVGNLLDVPADGLFANGMSLLHAIIGFLQSYPDELDGNILPWMVHVKRIALEVLKHLWSSKLSSYFTLAEMRASNFLLTSFSSQPLVGPNTRWDGVPIAAEQFWACQSTTALAEFLLFRGYLFDYAATEIRSAAKIGSPTLLANILSTLFGSSTSDTGANIPNPTVFDLFDFADLDVQFYAQPPELIYLAGLNIDVCAKPQADGSSLILYELAEVGELIRARREELLESGELRTQDSELFTAEADSLTLYLQAKNQSELINLNRHMALRSWAELLTTMLACSELEGGRKLTFILHAIQLILPKLEAAIEENLPEGVELARLAETLLDNLESGSAELAPSRRNGDIVDEKLHQLFQICVRGIILVTGNVQLKETFYNICSLYISRIVSPDTGNESMRHHSQQVIRSSGRALVEAICDDAYSGQETCRVSALLLLNFLATLDRYADAVLAESISQSNYLSLFLDSIRVLPLELKNAQANETPLLLSYYESLLSLLQQLCQTKPGATQVLKAGLFQAVRESHLFAADPDLGIDIDNPDALRKYYDLLDSVLRVIATAAFSRGLHNEQMLEQTRAFLTENRQSMVGIFKRFAKIGGAAAPGHHDALTSIAKSYTALVAATDFLEVEENEVTEHIGPKLFS